MTETSEPGIVVVSIDTEQIWGYLDCLNEAAIRSAIPRRAGSPPKLLARLCAAGVRATWLVVGGLALRRDGPGLGPRVSSPIARTHPYSCRR